MLAGWILRRFGFSALSLAGVIAAVFLLTHWIPGNPALVMAGTFATAETVHRMEHELGLDLPRSVQFLHYVRGLFHGDLGMSATTGHAVLQDLLQRLPVSIELSITAFVISVVIGLPLGVAAGLKTKSLWSAIGESTVVFGASAPLFWLGLVVIFVFYYLLGVEPSPTGQFAMSLAQPPHITGFGLVDALVAGDSAGFWSAFSHLMWPATTLGLVLVGPIVKIVRVSTREVLQSDFVRTARALGLPFRVYLRQDVLRNALLPILTIAGIQLGYMFGGNVIIERVFDWPGVGNYAWTALMDNDFNAIQGFVLAVGILYISLNLIIDVLYALIDPRIRYE